MMLAALLIALVLYSQSAHAATVTVQPGDSVWKLGQAYGVPADVVLDANGGNALIFAGQELDVPDVYHVQPGDSLWLISRAYGTTVEAVQWLNRLNGTYIYVGQRLYIPAASPPQAGQRREPVTVNRGVSGRPNLDLMARVIQAEAGGEPYAGMVGVGAVILNRVRDSRFPNSIEGVIYQPYAFEVVSNGALWWQTPTGTSYRAAQDALSGYDPTYGALYFWNPYVAGWAGGHTVTTQIGSHVFAR